MQSEFTLDLSPMEEEFGSEDHGHEAEVGFGQRLMLVLI